MKIAFIHYHLKPGGVTRVIQQQIGVCEKLGWEYCILAGENPLDMHNVRVISELHYDLHRSGLGNDGNGKRPHEILADQIENAIRSFFRCSPVSLNSSDEPSAGSRDNAGDFTSAGGPCADIIHVHNATLAKNSDLLPALDVLKQRGNRLFCQLHDFAEDGRPTVYSSSPYPADVHYGYINSRDGANLAAAGVPERLLHAIPNLISPLPGAIPPDGQLPPELLHSAGTEADPDGQDGSGKAAGSKSAADIDRTDASGKAASRGSASGKKTATGRGRSADGAAAKRLAIYPVRGIRRKNLGEAVLLTALVDNLELGITLEPNNPADRPSYDFWRALVEETGLTVHFNIARTMGFEKALEKADFFVSTSVQEGFGFAFLEPWTLGKAVAGRRIPYVHKDFAASGMKMKCFYDSIPIPVEAVDMESFRELWLHEAERRLSRFRIALRNQNLDSGAERTRQITESLNSRFDEIYGQSPVIDFGRLDRHNQAAVIHRVMADSTFRQALRGSIPVINRAPFTGIDDECSESLTANHRLVYSAYGIENYSSRLESIYRAILTDEPLPVGNARNDKHNNERNGTAAPSAGKNGAACGPKIDKEALLFAFLDPAGIFLVSSL